MFPISSTALTAPGTVALRPVAPTAETSAVNAATVGAVGSALDAPAPASVSVELSPVARFLLTVSQSQQQITQLQAAVANGADPQEAAQRASALNDATQNVVTAFNLLPSVDFNQAQPQSTSLLNNLVQSLNQQTASGNATQQQTPAQSLARIGVTLQPPLLSDATGGLSLDNEVLRAAFNSDGQNTTSTLQNTLDTFGRIATQFAEQLSAAGSAALPALTSSQPAALTPADAAANARLDLARAEIDTLSQLPLPTTGADRLAAQRAALEQPASQQSLAPPSPIVNPLQASTAEVIAAQNADARRAAANAAATPLQPAQLDQTDSTVTTQVAAADQAAAGQADNAAATQAAPADQAQDSGTAQAAAQSTAEAARATAAAQSARQQSTAGLSAATAASTQAATQATIAQNAAANAAANNPANATPAQQATAAQSAAANAAAAATAAASQAQAAQNAADALAAQNAAANAAAAQARAAQSTAATPEDANAAAAIAAQQASAAQVTATSLAAANAAAATAAQQAAAAQNAAEQASAAQVAAAQAASRAPVDPLRANPALAAAIAAYNISDPAVLGANARAALPAGSAIPRVGAVGAAARARGVGNGP